jgi:long-chain fatty acid transport protein
MKRRAKRNLGAVLSMSALAVAGNAMAGGFYIQEQSAAGVGRAQAGNVVAADDASTIYFNPAGLTELEGIQTASGIDLIVPSASLSDNGTVDHSLGASLGNPSSHGYSAPGGNSGGNPGSATPIPDFYLSAQIPDTPLTLGFGVTAPFGFASKFAQGFFGRYDSIDSFVETIDFAPTIAWKVNDWLSLGAGLDEQYAYVKLRNALPDPLSLTGPSPSTDGRLTLSGHTWTTGFNVGILLKPTPDTKIGLTYREGITHNIKGSLTISGLSGLLKGQNEQVSGDAALDLPDIMSAGISQKITPELTLLGEFDYYTWSNFQEIDIHAGGGLGQLITPEGYRDTFSVAVGGEYQLTPELKLRGGLKYDQTPTTDIDRDTRVPDGDRVWLAGGVHYKLTENLGLDGGYAHIFVTDSNIDISRSFYGQVPIILTTSTIRATSHVSLDILTAGFTYRF